jgi:hypothetical protein
MYLAVSPTGSRAASFSGLAFGPLEDGLEALVTLAGYVTRSPVTVASLLIARVNRHGISSLSRPRHGGHPRPSLSRASSFSCTARQTYSWSTWATRPSDRPSSAHRIWSTSPLPCCSLEAALYVSPSHTPERCAPSNP